MIKKFGTVTITEDDIVVSGFIFEGGDPENDAVKWAIARIKSAQHSVQSDGSQAEHKESCLCSRDCYCTC